MSSPRRTKCSTVRNKWERMFPECTSRRQAGRHSFVLCRSFGCEMCAGPFIVELPFPTARGNLPAEAPASPSPKKMPACEIYLRFTLVPQCEIRRLVASARPGFCTGLSFSAAVVYQVLAKMPPGHSRRRARFRDSARTGGCILSVRAVKFFRYAGMIWVAKLGIVNGINGFFIFR